MPLLPVHNTLGKRCKKQPDFTPFHRICQNGVKTRRYLHRFYVEPLSPEYQNDSKTPVRFVRKMVGIYGQVDVLSLLSGERPVFTDKLYFPDLG